MSRKILLFVSIFAGIILPGCRNNQSSYHKIEPAHLSRIEGSEVSRLTLTSLAAERLDIQTIPVWEEISRQEEGGMQKVVPYSAILYDVEGRTWIYSSPVSLQFVRLEVVIDFIEGDKAILTEGPQVGTNVVTVGAAELFGTEFNVGH